MPYKDPEKQRTTMRIAVRKFRERQKSIIERTKNRIGFLELEVQRLTRMNEKLLQDKAIRNLTLWGVV